jgi:protein-disulfide isomerase
MRSHPKESGISGAFWLAAVCACLAQFKGAHAAQPPRAMVSVDPDRVRGPANAPITIIEFADFECPFCAEAEGTMRTLMAKYPGQIRFAYRDFPWDFHPQARPSAEASRCALAQGKYWEYHDLLYMNQSRRYAGDLSEFAAALNMDLPKFDKCIADRSFAADVQKDFDAGKDLRISGTPAFFINGILVTGAVSVQEFSRIIDAELAGRASTSESEARFRHSGRTQ